MGCMDTAGGEQDPWGRGCKKTPKRGHNDLAVLKKAETFCIWNDGDVWSPAARQSHSPSQGSAHPQQSLRWSHTNSTAPKPATRLFYLSQPIGEECCCKALTALHLTCHPPTCTGGFSSSGPPHAGSGTSSLSCGCSPRALRAVWYYSWHLCLNTSDLWAQ